MTLFAQTSATVPHVARGRRNAEVLNGRARLEVVRMLREDHQLLKAAFRDFDRLECGQNFEACEQLVQQTCLELELHARLKAEVLYPGLRSAVAEAPWVDEAEIKHETVMTLIRQLRGMTPQDDKYAATFKVLGQFMRYFMREEEIKVLRQTAHFKLDWTRMFEEMQDGRNDLMEELGSRHSARGH